MSAMHKLRELFLYQPQTTPGMDYSTAGALTLAASDIAQVLKGSNADLNISIEPIEIVAGGFDQYSAVPGKETGKVSLQFAMNPASGNNQVLPQWGKVLYGSCNFALTSTAPGGTAPSQFSLAPASVFSTSGVLDHYAGSQETSGALKKRFYNLAGTFKIAGEANKVPVITFDMDGAFHSETDATQPDISSTKARETPYSLKGATILVIGSSLYKIKSFEVDGSQTTVNREDPSEQNGAGYSDVTDRKIKVSIKCYAMTKATVDPLVALRNQTEGAFKIQWGTSPKDIQLLGNYMQITERKSSDENNIAAFDIKGQLNRNDFTIGIGV